MDHINAQDLHAVGKQKTTEAEGTQSLQVDGDQLAKISARKDISNASSVLKGLRSDTDEGIHSDSDMSSAPTSLRSSLESLDSATDVDAPVLNDDVQHMDAILDLHEHDVALEVFEKCPSAFAWKALTNGRFGFRSKALKSLDKDIQNYMSAPFKPDHLAEETYHLVRLHNSLKAYQSAHPKSNAVMVDQLLSETSEAIKTQQAYISEMKQDVEDPLAGVSAQFKAVKPSDNQLKADAKAAIETGSSYKVRDFKSLKTLMSTAKRSTNPEKTSRFLSVYNQQVAPKLTRESDALEYMAVKLAYLKLNVGDEVKMNVTEHASASRKSPYAHSYKVTNTFIDRSGESDMVGYTFAPFKSDGSQDEVSNPIVVFRGTAFTMDRAAAADGHGKGINDDRDRNGIGFRSFSKHEDQVSAWIQGQLAANPFRSVSVIGHSLGGTLASRAMCALPKESQARVHVTTFQAPGLDATTAGKFDRANAKNVVHHMNGGDPVVRFGSEHLPTADGQVQSYKGARFSPKSNHLATPGTKRVLNGSDEARSAVPVTNFKPKTVYEAIRKFFGRRS
ncbi:MAG: hypothetical protein O3A01_07475 [bacterium]|nr:hypothetical protein [bacterium]